MGYHSANSGMQFSPMFDLIYQAFCQCMACLISQDDHCGQRGDYAVAPLFDPLAPPCTMAQTISAATET